jgi:lipopolysaccharide biosynthesis glycosyltransferase
MKNINQLNQMRILLTFDTGYAPHAATVMESIIRNCPEKLDFVIMYCDLNKETQDILSSHFKSKVRHLEFVEIDEDLRKKLPQQTVLKHLTLNTYIRLWAPEVLKDNTILYLDCDIVVLNNIKLLMEQAKEMQNNYAVCGVEDSYYTIPNKSWYLKKILGCNPDTPLTNCGVMVMNLKLWRQNNLSRELFTFIADYHDKLHCADQCALNSFLKGRFGILCPEWNVYENMLYKKSFPMYLLYDTTRLKYAVKKPAIVHFTGPNKPWCYMCTSLYKNVYWKYRKNTPWPEKKYNDKSLEKIFIKKVRNPLVRITKSVIGEKTATRIKSFLRY